MCGTESRQKMHSNRDGQRRYNHLAKPNAKYVNLHWPIKPPFSALIMGYPPRMDGMLIIQCMGWIATAMHVVFKRIHIARNEVHVRCQAWSFAQNRTSGFISEPKKHIPYVFFNGALINKCDRITILLLFL
eukprot:198910_1